MCCCACVCRPRVTEPDLTPAQRQLVQDILNRYAPGCKAWVFGSRATGRARPYSDLDLLVQAPAAAPWLGRLALADAFEASTLPFRVDLVDVVSLNPAYADRVWAEALPLV
jgi:uncharacterized protein